jgi:hypothetical protein
MMPQPAAKLHVPPALASSDPTRRQTGRTEAQLDKWPFAMARSTVHHDFPLVPLTNSRDKWPLVRETLRKDKWPLTATTAHHDKWPLRQDKWPIQDMKRRSL